MVMNILIYLRQLLGLANGGQMGPPLNKFNKKWFAH